MGRTSFAVRMVTAFVLFCSVLAPFVATSPAAARDVPEDIDLAAILPTTDDFDAAGFDRYHIGRSDVSDLADHPVKIEFDNGLDLDEQRRILNDSGFLRSQTIWFRSPRDSGESESKSQVVTMVALYEDAEGAETSFSLLGDASSDPMAVELEGWDDFGDASKAVLLDVGDGRTGLIVLVLIDNLTFSFDAYYPEDEPVDERDFIDVIDITLDRIETGLAAQQPAISNLVFRFEQSEDWRDLYMWRDGSSARYTNDTLSPEEYARYYESIGQTEEYWMGTVINGTDAAASTDNVWHDATIRRFESARAAEATYGELQDSWSDPVNWSSIEFVDVDFGDESFSLDVEYDQSGVRIYQSFVMVRYDDIILEFGFRAPSPTRDALDSMTDAQIDCFEDEDCLGFSPFTNEVLTLAGLDNPNDDAPSEPEDDDRSDSIDKTDVTFPSSDEGASRAPDALRQPAQTSQMHAIHPAPARFEAARVVSISEFHLKHPRFDN